jgi:hypothetical protein
MNTGIVSRFLTAGFVFDISQGYCPCRGRISCGPQRGSFPPCDSIICCHYSRFAVPYKNRRAGTPRPSKPFRTRMPLLSKTRTCRGGLAMNRSFYSGSWLDRPPRRNPAAVSQAFPYKNPGRLFRLPGFSLTLTSYSYFSWFPA